jgi:hypothetical protein
VTNISIFDNDIRDSINASGYNHLFAEDSASRRNMGMGGFEKLVTVLVQD